MNLEEFIERFKESFDQLVTPINENTNYKEIDEWTSMQALFFIAHLDDKTGVVLSAEDLIETTTLNELYSLVLKRI